MCKIEPYLDKAKAYFDDNDYKACAIYLRTAFEDSYQEVLRKGESPSQIPAKTRKSLTKRRFLGTDKKNGE